jgi:hypothetical protein
VCSDSPLPRVHRGRISLRALTPTKPCLQHTRTWFNCVQLRSMSTGRASPMIDAAELISASETERRTMLEVRFSSLRCQLGSQISSGSAAPRFGAVRAGCQQCGCLQAHRDDRPFIVQVDPSLPSNCLDRSGIGREVFSWREMTPRRFRRQARLSYVDRDSFGMPVLAAVEVYL